MKWARALDAQLSADGADGAAAPGGRRASSGCTSRAARRRAPSPRSPTSASAATSPTSASTSSRRSTSGWAARSAPTPGSSTGSTAPCRSTRCPTPCCGSSAATSDERRPDEPFYHWARRTAAATSWPPRWPAHGRGGGVMKGYRIREEMNGIAEPPGKTWFWELEAGVIDADRCIQCGTCVAVCPSNSIGVDEDTDLPELVKMCTGCSLCWDFCPRGGLRYEALWPPSTLDGDEDAEVHRPGAVRLRRHLLEDHRRPARRRARRGRRSYAVRAGAADRRRPGRRRGQRPADRAAGRPGRSTAPWSPSRATIPTSPGRASPPWPPRPRRSSPPRAASTTRPWRWPSSTCRKYDLPAKPRIAVVGTPCEIQGIRAMQARRWPTGRAPGRRGGADHRPAVHEELRLRGADAARAARQAGHRPRPGQQGRRHPRPDDRRVPRRRGGGGRAGQGLPRRRAQGLRRVRRLPRPRRRPLGRQRRLDGRVDQRAGPHRARPPRLRGARAKLDVRDLDDPEALVRLDALDKRIADRTLQRKLDPDAPLFIDFAEHVRAYDGTDRQPVYIRR